MSLTPPPNGSPISLWGRPREPYFKAQVFGGHLKFTPQHSYAMFSPDRTQKCVSSTVRDLSGDQGCLPRPRGVSGHWSRTETSKDMPRFSSCRGYDVGHFQKSMGEHLISVPGAPNGGCYYHFCLWATQGNRSQGEKATGDLQLLTAPAGLLLVTGGTGQRSRGEEPSLLHSATQVHRNSLRGSVFKPLCIVDYKLL